MIGTKALTRKILSCRPTAWTCGLPALKEVVE